MPEIVYTDTIGYPQKRNIIDLPHSQYKIEKRLNAFRVPNALYFKYYNSSNSFFLNSHYEPFKRGNLHHFFNTISFGNSPWITTFETLLPRWGKVSKKLERKGVELLAGKKCKKLIAISECTRDIQSLYLNNFPDIKEEILQKTLILHPPQKKLIDSVDDKFLSQDAIIFTFIGADFFRKGGKEILAVFDKLLIAEAPVKLNIVSSLQYGDYASCTSSNHKIESINLINKFPKQIKWYTKLNNIEVLSLLQKSHIGLLPTYADTYGYAVLEAQAAGCPVITTNIRALSEINNNDCGWVIEVPKDEKGDGRIRTEKERNLFSSIIEDNLLKICLEILENPKICQTKGSAALERIIKYHNPEKAALFLNKIYKSV